eukprot:SAG31_NODE_10_length_40133_cov_27.863041_33_plen_158_part_00
MAISSVAKFGASMFNNSSMWNGGDDTAVDQQRRSVHNLKVLTQAIVGQSQKAEASPEAFGGGQPRKWRPSRTLDELEDAQPVERAAWVSGGMTADLPRRLERQRKRKGGALAIVRDVSGSMNGPNAEWSSALILQVLSFSLLFVLASKVSSHCIVVA